MATKQRRRCISCVSGYTRSSQNWKRNWPPCLLSLPKALANTCKRLRKVKTQNWIPEARAQSCAGQPSRACAGLLTFSMVLQLPEIASCFDAVDKASPQMLSCCAPPLPPSRLLHEEKYLHRNPHQDDEEALRADLARRCVFLS